MNKAACVFLMIISINSYSAINALSHHSRANCVGFNETITWWLGHPIYSRVISTHYPDCLRGSKRNKHTLKSNKVKSYRHAALHAKESYGGSYCVVGDHFMYIRGVEHLVQSESVNDCAIYDGWWDY